MFGWHEEKIITKKALNRALECAAAVCSEWMQQALVRRCFAVSLICVVYGFGPRRSRTLLIGWRV
jgi:uncharacterized membrane protein